MKKEEKNMNEKKMLYAPLDLDLIGDLADVYERAKNSIKYLTDFCGSIEARLKKGEKIPRLLLVEGNRTRYITDIGIKVLEKNLGEKLYTRKVIGITELENLVGKDKMEEFAELGVIDYKAGSPKVIIQNK